MNSSPSCTDEPDDSFVCYSRRHRPVHDCHVELGKQLAKVIQPKLACEDPVTSLDVSTYGLFNFFQFQLQCLVKLMSSFIASYLKIFNL
ncbi:hypothetical protein ANCDUO_06614 [Ancylostoma duodenale]|uniref:Uncharacterized protein n=1 Tax=Ancylostoma duodenale TaxID=51022 RepID=A0A0C2GP32_9BILA|nr:hypothetical protein ANCDUO_06614 [Ancylostoma duodenale]